MQNATADAPPLLEVKGLTKHFPVRKSAFSFGPRTVVRAVDGVDFSVLESQTLGLVGESGCGKSTTGRMLLRLIEPTEGSVHYGGVDLLSLRTRDMRNLRRELQIIFQDPFGSLNPRMTVEDIISEPLIIHREERAGRAARVAELLDLVGLARNYAKRYPHEFSGGQRQRIGIARALALRPRFVVCDEAVSALDVSVQAQIVNLMRDLQAELKLAYLFISHNLGIVRHIAHQVAVMYLGQIVETGSTAEVFASPSHPYTQALLSSVPVAEPGQQTRRLRLAGDAESQPAPTVGCRFRTRCPKAAAICAEQQPRLAPVGTGQAAACHFPDVPVAGPPKAAGPYRETVQPD